MAKTRRPPAPRSVFARGEIYMKILIADDDKVSQLLLRSALARLGHEVVETSDGTEAWAAWQQDRFPVVILDWMMPGLDGLELCRKIRAEHRASYSYIILLTARAGKAYYLDGIEAGADDFMTKPLEKDILAARIQVAERILGLHAELQSMNADLEQRVADGTAELKNALQVKSEFLSRASHELRTPMNHVLGFAQLLEVDELSADQAESVRQILDSGAHLLNLIDRILAVSDSDSADLSFLEEPGNDDVAYSMGRGQPL